MRIIFSILLLLATALYILPVKEFVCKEYTNISMADMEEEKCEAKKKEKELSFFSFSDKFILHIKQGSPQTLHHCYPIPVLFNSVETPPPNQL